MSYSYRVRIEKETTPALQDLAADLGFIVTRPTRFTGQPSPGSLLDTLAAAYRRDPGGVVGALRALGIVPPDDATPPSE